MKIIIVLAETNHWGFPKFGDLIGVLVKGIYFFGVYIGGPLLS